MKLVKLIRRLLFLILIVAICAGASVAGNGYKMYKDALAEKDMKTAVKEVQDKEHYTQLEELPETYLNAVISVEDHRFYYHPGIDPLAIARAVINDMKAGALVEGGSTITQQLAKNMFFTQEKELTRKAAEVFMAFDLERNYTKDEILELYVNMIYFGSGYYCVADASQGYFNKEPGAMTKYESTLLAGIPNAPSAYAPTANPELSIQRQSQVLSRMVKCGYITEEEAKAVSASSSQAE